MIGQLLTHYAIREKIGAGGMGVVYRAHDEQLSRDVAIKVLPSELLRDDSARKRFRKEALALAKLNHPNIETVHEFGNAEGLDFLVTEYIPGITLNAKLAAGTLPERQVLSLGIQVAEGLESAHRAGVVHRDSPKAKNISAGCPCQKANGWRQKANGWRFSEIPSHLCDTTSATWLGDVWCDGH